VLEPGGEWGAGQALCRRI